MCGASLPALIRAAEGLRTRLPQAARRAVQTVQQHEELLDEQSDEVELMRQRLSEMKVRSEIATCQTPWRGSAVLAGVRPRGAPPAATRQLRSLTHAASSPQSDNAK